MHTKDGTIIDRREMLKVKLKSLAAEARFIRKEELRSHGALREELYRHRIDVVRSEARHTHLAYGLIRGRTIGEIEGKSLRPYNKDRVDKMVLKYGAVVTIPKVAIAA